MSNTNDKKDINKPSSSEEEKKSQHLEQKQQEELANALVEAIEEDDEFEEFEPCDWNKTAEDVEDLQQWQVR